MIYPVFLATLLFQPGIGQNGVVNAASQTPPTLPGGAIARGALFQINGVRLAGKTTVTISGLPLKVMSQSPKKLEVLMAPNAPLGPARLVVTVDGLASKHFLTQVAASNPGIFSRNQEGWGPARIEGNSLEKPAHPGQTIFLAATGVGAAKTFSVMVGNRVANGVAVHTAREGEDRVTFQVPADAPTGCWVPVYLQAAPNRVSNVVTISIRQGAGRCDPGPVPVWSTQRMIFVALSRTQMKALRSGKPDPISDEASVGARAPIQDRVLLRHDLLPPPGTCTAFSGSFQADTDLSLSLSATSVPDGSGLDAGPALTLVREGQNEIRDVGEMWNSPGKYRSHLGLDAVESKRLGPGLFLDPGVFRLEGSGGTDVGPFKLAFSVPAPFEWIDRNAISVIARDKGVTVHWKNATGDQLMVLLARSLDPVTTASGVCICTARGNAGQFAIPAAMFANFPSSIDTPRQRLNELIVGSLTTKPAQFHAKGLDGGVVFTVFNSRRLVEYH